MAMAKGLLRLAVPREGGTGKGGPYVKILTQDGQEIGGVLKVEVKPFDGNSGLIEAEITVLIEIEAMGDIRPTE